uniref:ATP synthase CF0 subunit I n=1 Tax=Thalassionema bacillare TaxID=426664 RepID=UPI001EE04E15|nr:ATP synthase CF0 subunit I [Thalassionema bacillare]UHY40499.1 ATP synthase CF0 subunit I [Thalassionema bacillare]UHY40886.1 ATP synthase CF0 subunit I [Thalassionema bacillare]UHY41144.1 ATP synthase CF0 subunit I [Thalassionema bacillare]
MENFNQIFNLIAEEDGFTLDPMILESGVINIVGLIAIILFVAKDGLGQSLRERNETISQNVKDAENRLNEAEKRLTDAQKQLNQANVVISKIKSDTLNTKKLMLEADANEAKNDLKFRFERGMLVFKSKERQIFYEIKEQITSLVMTRTVTRVKETFAQEKPSAKLINNTIRTLELPS